MNRISKWRDDVERARKNKFEFSRENESFVEKCTFGILRNFHSGGKKDLGPRDTIPLTTRDLLEAIDRYSMDSVVALKVLLSIIYVYMI